MSALLEAIDQYRCAALHYAESAAWAKAEQARVLTSIQESLDAAASAKAALADAEAALHQATLAAFQATGDKAPAPGVGIREVTKFRYNMDKALRWALDHHLALTLEVKAFETLCKSASTRPAFVEVHTVATPTISASLSKGEG